MAKRAEADERLALVRRDIRRKLQSSVIGVAAAGTIAVVMMATPCPGWVIPFGIIGAQEIAAGAYTSFLAWRDARREAR